MKNIGRNLRIGLLMIAIIVTTAIIAFVYINAILSVRTLKSNITGLQARFDELTEKNLNANNYNYELKYIKYEIDQVKKILPPDIIQERIILSLRRIEQASGAKMTSIKFSSLEKVEKTASAQKPDGGSLPSKINIVDGDQLQMKVEINFRAPYKELKDMLEEISLEENRVIIDNISMERETNNSHILKGSVNLTFCALKDSKRSFDQWELQLEKGMDDLFLPFDGYEVNDYGTTEKVILPEIDEESKSEKTTSDFYLLASPFNDEKPAVLIGKYESINSEIYYDGNNMIDINFYVEEQNGQMYYRTRTKQMPFPDENNSVLFFPKKDDVTMNIISSAIVGGNDKVRVRLNMYNNTERRITVFTDDSSERVSVVVKEGRITTEQKDLHTTID